MGSGDISYIIGIGSMWLRNRDRSIRVLTDVPFVPKLKKNIISLGVLESKGLIVIILDGVLKVILIILIVMKGMRRSNSYYYNGNIVIGVATQFLVVMKI